MMRSRLLVCSVLAATALAFAPGAVDAAGADSLTVMTWNTMHWGWDKQPEAQKADRERTMFDVILASGADVVLIQETYGSFDRFLKGLPGWHGALLGSCNAVFSRYPIVRTYKPYSEPVLYGCSIGYDYKGRTGPFNIAVAELDVGGRRVRVCPVALNWQPYCTQMSETMTEREALAWERAPQPNKGRPRPQAMAAILDSMSDMIAEADVVPLIIGGDFNSQSHLDWTEATRDRLGHGGRTIGWEVSKRMSERGFVDTWRHLHPDAARDYGVTCGWRDCSDKSTRVDLRLDYIYSLGRTLKPVDSETVNFFYLDPFDYRGRTYAHFPSDHGFVVTRFSIDDSVRQVPGEELQRQIDAAAARGGGRVTVPSGIHPCRTIYLKSGVELHLEKGAVLMGPSDWREYDDVDDTCIGKRPEGSSKVLIAAYGATNVAITGEGVIDARGPLFYDTDVPQGEHFKKPNHPRPRMLQFFRCRGVRFEDVTFRDSPGWTCWLRECEDIEVTRLHILADQRMINNDGLHIDGCRHIRIGESEFRTGDDCVVMRANRAEGTHLVCEDMIVSNCTMDSTCQSVRLSCPSDDTIRHARFFNLKMSGNNGVTCGLPAHYVAPWDEGCAMIEDIVFENCTIDAKWHPICFYADPGVKARSFGNVTFRNITLRSELPIMLKGTADAPLVNLRFENVRGSIAAKNPFDMAGVEGLVFDKVELSSGKGRPVPFERPSSTSWESQRWPFAPSVK